MSERNRSIAARMTLGALLLAGLSLPIVGCGTGNEAATANNNKGIDPMETETAQPAAPQSPPAVIIETSKGAIELTLWEDKAPVTVSNFMAYVESDFYDNLIFHRVIDGFMIQGGGFDASMQQKKTRAPIKNEASSDAPNARGTIAMARTADVDSATAQFFINLVDNQFLNHRDKSARGFGYCAFGEVTDGMDVVDAIAKVSTGRHGMHADVPTEPVVIKTIRIK